MPTTPSAMLAKYGLAPSKRLGQNFLADENVARKIVSAAAAEPEDVVVEIGPGFGALTFGLAETARHVVAVEVDRGIARAFLEEYGEVEGVTLVAKDVLDVDLGRLAAQHGAEELLVVGNLPYSITSPVIRLIVSNPGLVARAVLMVQDEVGARVVAGPSESDYSALSVIVQYHARARSLFPVKRTCFHPRPKVDSRVIELRMDQAPRRASDPGAFSEVVHAAFGQRRKMLRQSLRAVLKARGLNPSDLEDASGIDLALRGEALSVEQFDALTLATTELSGDGREG